MKQLRIELRLELMDGKKVVNEKGTIFFYGLEGKRFKDLHGMAATEELARQMTKAIRCTVDLNAALCVLCDRLAREEPTPPKVFEEVVAPETIGNSEFQKEIENVINCGSMENGSDTPDFILAGFLADCLRALDKAVVARDGWYGNKGLREHLGVKDTRTHLTGNPR